MIISGYQGIGKSTLAGRDRFIDLESGNFWIGGKRADDWYIPYCNIALHLSSQGYKVFISSHKLVRDYLASLPKTEELVVVYPSLELKSDWICKLAVRYERTNLEKDYKSLMNAKNCYADNITDLMNQVNFGHIEIKSMDYNLQDLIEVYEVKNRDQYNKGFEAGRAWVNAKIYAAYKALQDGYTDEALGYLGELLDDHKEATDDEQS